MSEATSPSSSQVQAAYGAEQIQVLEGLEPSISNFSFIGGGHIFNSSANSSLITSILFDL